MLIRVEARTNQGTLLSMPLEDMSSGLFIEKITGLNPVKATLVSSSFANMDGEQFHSSRREARNMVITIGLEPDYVESTVSDLRDQLYDFFMPKSEVDLTFVMSSGLSVDIKGTVESFESELFGQEPTAEISLMCFDPDFKDPVPVTLSGVSAVGDDGSYVDYKGTVDTGMVLTIYVKGNLSEITVYNSPPDNSFRSMEISYPLINGDILTISTVPGDKYVTLTRNGTPVSALYAVSTRSSWIELQKGTNFVQVYVEGTPVQYSIQYTTRYGGL